MTKPVSLSPLPAEHVRSLIIMAAREGQAAIGRGPHGRDTVVACFESAASLARDYYAPTPPED